MLQLTGSGKSAKELAQASTLLLAQTLAFCIFVYGPHWNRNFDFRFYALHLLNLQIVLPLPA